MKRENLISGGNLIGMATAAHLLAIPRPVHLYALLLYSAFVAWHVFQNIRHRFDKDGVEMAVFAAVILASAIVVGVDRM